MSSASEIPPLSHENTLGPYRLLRVLGEGGMGMVYLAQDKALGRHLAVKVLRVEGGKEAAARAAAKRFLREAQSAAKLNHPHVVTIYAVGQHGGRPYIAMEFVEGGSLAQQLRTEGPLHWRAAARAMRDALRGLAAGHQAGIVHRDVKPANLMRARDGAGEAVIKLADFGLARMALADSELTFPGAFVGSPNYSAPEQVAGAARIDGRADLYSLAATAYALVTGEPPFVAEDPEEVMERHLREEFPDVRALAPTVPAEFAAVLARASQKRPEDRYENAREMLNAVEGLLALPEDVAPAAVARKRAEGTFRPSSAAEATVAELETRLARARKLADSSTQLDTLRTLYGLYVQLDRRDEARRAFREALVVHVKMRAPSVN
jgi:serine/threonine protein kinase